MKLIVGLGNPGEQYEKTRHNVGFVVIDRLARRLAPGAIARSKFHGALIEADLNGERILLHRPSTYMNRSGQAVAEAARFYKLQAETDLLVIVDDVALQCGVIRVRAEGGTGGHNGLADIEQKLGVSEYARLRIGIDPPGQIPQADYVLGRFRPDQSELMEPGFDEAVSAALCWATLGIKEAMNRFNRKNTAKAV